MITGKDTLEMAVFMTIGQENLRVNLKLKFIGSRWMCIYADLADQTAPPSHRFLRCSGRRFCRVIGWFAYSSDHA